jgi:cell division protein FtsN
MAKANKRHPIEIRFSPLSLLCLFFCWVGATGLAFYLGILVGRMEQMREIRTHYRADESVVAEEELPPLSFEESLMLPEEELKQSTLSLPKSPPEEPLAELGAEGTSGQEKVLQVASFRKPEHAERLVRELRDKGYPCFQRFSGPSASGEGYSRVYVGPLPSAEVAVQVKDRLEKQEGYQGIMIRSIGKKAKL